MVGRVSLITPRKQAENLLYTKIKHEYTKIIYTAIKPICSRGHNTMAQPGHVVIFFIFIIKRSKATVHLLIPSSHPQFTVYKKYNALLLNKLLCLLLYIFSNDDITPLYPAL